MPEKKKWDLSSTRSMQAAAEWIRARGGAQIVLVIRKDDWAVAHDVSLAPLDVRDSVRDTLVPMLNAMLSKKGKP